jgi:hypothetical protein
MIEGISVQELMKKKKKKKEAGQPNLKDRG